MKEYFIPVSVFITKDIVMNVVQIENGIACGYNLLTEEFVCVPEKDLKPIPPIILDIIKHERLRYSICRKLAYKREVLGQMMGVTVRTAFRMAKEYD